LGRSRAEIECRKCHCTEVRRMSRRGLVERWIYPLMRIYPFLCGRCGRRFHAMMTGEKAGQFTRRPEVSRIIHISR
jgi:hypothetical protein